MSAALLLFHLILLSGSAFCCAVYGSRFEDGLPLSCSCLVLLLFPFGLAGHLSWGVFALLALAAGLWIAAFFRLFRSGGWHAFSRRCFSPGFWLYLLLSVSLVFLNRGRQVLAWDDFSHWGDIVKVMLSRGTFGYAAGTGSLFPEYPPAMALFQYALQQLLHLTAPAAGFTEWLLFYAYQLFFYLLPMPLLTRLVKGRAAPLWLLLFFLAPFAFFDTMHAELKIDPFLGALFACIMAQIFVDREPGSLAFPVITAALAVLVLSKTSGILFSSLALLAFWLSLDASMRRWRFAALAAVLLPFTLWHAAVFFSGASRAFAVSLDGGLITPFRIEALKQFVLGFFSMRVNAGGAVVGGLSAVFLTVLSLSLLWFACRCYERLFPALAVRYRRLFLVAALAYPVFFAGLCLSYLFSFTQEEALTLAGYSRYISTVFFAGELLLLLLGADLIACKGIRGDKLLLSLLCVMTAVTPFLSVIHFLGRSNVQYSMEYRRRFAAGETAITSLSQDKPLRIYVLSLDPLDDILLRYTLRPNTVNGPDTWFGYGEPGAAPGEPSVNADQWQALLAGEYDGVFLYSISQEFPARYASVFEDPSQIRDQTLYLVDRSTGRLSFWADCSSAP